MTVKIDGTNTVANPAFTGADTDTGLQCGTNELKLVTGGTSRIEVNAANAAAVTIPQNGNQLLLKQTDTDSGYLFGCNNTNGDLTFTRRSAGSNSEEFRMLAGGGLTFGGDTAQANALDKYEEGTWVPTINTTTTPITGITYTRQAGYYTKIGNVCHVSMWISWSARTNTSGSTACISLPFASNSSGNYRGAMHVSTENCTYNSYGFDSSSGRNIGAMAGTHLNTNVAYMEISFTGKNGGGWGSAGILISGLGASGGDMQLSGTYLVQ